MLDAEPIPSVTATNATTTLVEKPRKWAYLKSGVNEKYGFEILNQLSETNSLKTTWYLVRWTCCDRKDYVNQFSLTERVKRHPEGISICVSCSRRINQRKTYRVSEPKLTPSNLLPKGMVSAATAWPLPSKRQPVSG